MIATAALFVSAALLVRLVPRWLDRPAYRGPPSDHFDGQRFFNPGTLPAPRSRRALLRFLLGRDRARWPARVPVTPRVPAARIEGATLRVTWIGHATVLVQTRGLNILTDPVWSTRAGPIPGLGPKRVVAPGVAFDDLPPIDVVLLSHGHYDHLDLPTLRRLWTRDRPRIIVPLGHDRLLARAGIASEPHDWNDRVAIGADVAVVLTPAHHWTSRWGVDRNRALWCGFALLLPDGHVFFAGDTAMADGGWLDAVAAHAPYRLALMPIGAYRPRALMAQSHVDPDEAVAIVRRIGAAHALALHWGTFQLTDEPYDDPRERLAVAAETLGPSRFRAVPPGTEWDVPAL